MLDVRNNDRWMRFFNVFAFIVVLPASIIAGNIFNRFVYHGHWTISCLCFAACLMSIYQSIPSIKNGRILLFLVTFLLLNFIIPFTPFGDDRHLSLAFMFPLLALDYAIFYFGSEYLKGRSNS